MAPRNFNSGPRLPQALREKIEEQENAEGRRRGNRNPSRREARKEQRHAKKERKANHFSQGRKLEDVHVERKGTLKRSAEESVHDDRHSKKRRLDSGSRNGSNTPKPTASQKRVEESRPLHHHSSESTPLAKLEARLTAGPDATKSKAKRTVNASRRSTTVPKTQAEIDEDKRISRYEHLLSKRGGGDEEDDDGLDDLLSFADKIVQDGGVEMSYEGPEEDAEDEEYEGSEDDENDTSDEVIIGDESDADEGVEASSEASEEFMGFGELEEEGSVVLDAAADETLPTSESAEVLGSGTGTVYIPPHLRKLHALQSESKESPERAKLKRQCQGLLNRLSEQNIASILPEIEALYRTYSRNDVTTTITTLVLSTISSRSNLLDSFVILYAALIASLTKIMGVEFGANFVHVLVTSYKHHHASLPASNPDEDITEDRGKECINLITLLSELYNFQVVSCVLIYDIVRDLLDGALTEFNVELLLKLLKDSGPQLRQDDSMALDDIVAIVQQKTADQDVRSLGSRTRFMIETLGNLKNNKSKAIQNQAVAAEATNRMKKVIAGLSKTHHVRPHEPLRVSLADLLSADQKGKWWLVGAAWAGDPITERQTQMSTDHNAAVAKETILRKLARKQGMNTEVRRNIFMVLMSSEDYVDAHERLDQLNLNEMQQREIMRVLLHCCGIEKTYNPFYTLVAQRLCQTSHAHKVTIQFVLWDFLRELGETEVGGAEIVKSAREREDTFVAFDVSTTTTRVKNLAKAFAWLVAKGASNLIIFRPVNFTSLQPRTVVFFHTFLVFLVLDSQLQTPIVDLTPQVELPKKRNREALEQVVMKAVANAALSKGLHFFISRSPPDTAKYSQAVGDIVEWGCDVMRDTLKAGMDLAATLT